MDGDVSRSQDGSRGSVNMRATVIGLREVLKEWGRIGCVGFGGPPAHVALLRDLCVERRGWIDAKEFEVELKGRAGARPKPKAKAKQAAGGTGVVLSQMTGRVIRVDVKPGDEVKEGDVMLVVEAMKMENEIAAPVSGTVKAVSVAAGARVAEGDPLVAIEPAAASV